MPVSTELPSHFALNTGATIPAIGLGTWQAKPGEVKDAVKHALQVGYRHIDGALIYQVSLMDEKNEMVEKVAAKDVAREGRP